MSTSGDLTEPGGTWPRLVPTPSQTAGPFVSLGMGWLADAGTVSESDPRAIVVAGSVLDGEERPVTDAVLEFWQSDASGASMVGSSGPPSGVARALTWPDGRYRLVTLKPAALPGPPGQLQAPHIDVSIFARGLLQRLVTRIYFSDEQANQADPVLGGLESPDLRSRLVAQCCNAHEASSANGPPAYRFDIHLQGDRETVFFGPW